MDPFGFVILTAVCGVFLNYYLAVRVGLSRQKYKVPLPDQYSDKHVEFNCAQRAYMNTSENLVIFYLLLFLGGDLFPRVCAIAGMVWIAGRIAYAHGYYTGKPENRARGSFAYFGLLVLLLSAIANGLNRLNVIDLN